MPDIIGKTISDVLNFNTVNLWDIVLTIGISIFLGLLIGWVYKYTHTGFGYSQSFVITLVMMSSVISLVILVVGNNTARAFSLAGALSIIRFRMSLREPKDIAYIFFATAAGLAAGSGAYVYAVIGVLMLCAFIIILTKLNIFAPDYTTKKLKVMIPEDLNYEGKFDPVLDRYCVSHSLLKVMNIDLGTLFELVYDVKVRKGVSEKEFMDELRTLNGNLKITLSVASDEVDY